MAKAIPQDTAIGYKKLRINTLLFRDGTWTSYQLASRVLRPCAPLAITIEFVKFGGVSLSINGFEHQY